MNYTNQAPDDKNFLVSTIFRTLFASIPPEYDSKFQRYLFGLCLNRLVIFTFIMALMDAFILLTYFLFDNDLNVNVTILYPYIILKILANLAVYFSLRKAVHREYHYDSFLFKHAIVLVGVFYIITEFLLFVLGPQDLSAYFRLCTVPFVTTIVVICKQTKISAILVLLHIATFLYLPYSTLSAVTIPFFSDITMAVIVLSSALLIAFTNYSAIVHKFITTLEALESNEKTTAVNAQLAQEVQLRTKLLKIANQISVDLVDTNQSDFDDVFQSCIKALGEALDVNHIILWKDERESETFSYEKLYTWSTGVVPLKQTSIPKTKPFAKEWCATLYRNYPIQGIVEDFPIGEKSYLAKSNAVSVMILPIRVFNEFWGYIRFDDCHNKRTFSSVELAIINSISLNLAIALYNHEMAAALKTTAEEALASAKAKSEFLANMSHEIRTPINAVTGMAKLARLTDDKNEILRCMDCIEGASKQLLGLINDILDMSKIEAGKIELADEPFVLSNVLENIKNTMSITIEAKEQELITDFDEALPDVIISDDMRLSQILLNLMSNAIKFTPKKGRIDLNAKLIKNHTDGTATMEFSVRDTGIGMNEDQMTHLFEKFEQADRGISRRFGGTGLGLAISKSISEIMHGGISVTSEPGKGSCFTVKVRLLIGDSDLVEDAQQSVNMEDLDFSPFRALLVEDIEINREIVLTMLEDTGIALDEAENGQIALDILEKDLDKYDLILIDLHMPVKDGYTTTEEFRAWDNPKAKTIPIIAMTADAFTGDIQRCKDAGMNDHVAKPIDFDELLTKMSLQLMPPTE